MNTPDKQKDAQDQKGGNGTVFGIVIGVIFAIFAVILLPTTIVVMVGLVPSAVAFFVDTSRERLLGSTVFSLNLAGVLPAVLGLWKHGHHVEGAINIITQPLMLTMILIPSGLGWLLYIYTPQFIGKIMRKRAVSRMKTLIRYQQDLVEQWGKAVASGHALPNGSNDQTAQDSADKNDLKEGTLSA